ncbi:Fcf2-domain-containing protein [Ascodesmis nigricans]|uniref:Fcf2-domain-containing protein n=1 Tax=Ascodesmis nigricans TaxID=341454 RepID=A0A4S2N5C0_9PEZI|nr:Fcf2-domain-containing protein [Ascodesmis nigricans]
MAPPTLTTTTPTTTATFSPTPGSAPSSATLRESSADLYSSYSNSSDSDDEDLDDAAISRLLREAEERMRSVSSSSSGVVARTGQKKKPLVVSLPKLDPGAGLPRSAVDGMGVKLVRPVRTAGMEIEMVTEKDVLNTSVEATKGKGKKEGPAPTAGSQWFDLPRTDLTNPTVLRDHLLLKSRNVLDPHRHYKKDTSALPEFSAVGTIIEGNTEFYSSRIARKERKKTIVEEILADGKSRERFKRKYEEVQGKKRSGKKADYKKLMEKRRRVKYAN